MSRVRSLAGALVRRLNRAERTGWAPPFAAAPVGDRDTYLQLHRTAQVMETPELDLYEREVGFAIDRGWLDELALVAQISIKDSPPNYHHGRILYATLRQYLESGPAAGAAVAVLETGTARGFSSLCLARALLDASPRGAGHVVTVDVLPHDRPLYWNCIGDHDGPQSRQELLSRWPLELARVVFLEGSVDGVLARLGLARVGFAFFDAAHTFVDVMREYVYVRERQRSGDVIVFDDVTPGAFDGVVEAVTAIEDGGLYEVSHVRSSNQRGYAIAVRV